MVPLSQLTWSAIVDKGAVDGLAVPAGGDVPIAEDLACAVTPCWLLKVRLLPHWLIEQA
jgi:hypothetical protein